MVAAHSGNPDGGCAAFHRLFDLSAQIHPEFCAFWFEVIPLLSIFQLINRTRILVFKG